PADEKLTLIRRHRIEPAGVGAPMRDSRHGQVQSDANLRRHRFERRVDITGPRNRSEPRHAGAAGSTKQKRPPVGPVARLALGEGLLPPEIVTVMHERSVAAGKRGARRRAFASIEPPAGNTQIAETPMRVPPPGTNIRPGEIDEPLTLTVDHGI